METINAETKNFIEEFSHQIKKKSDSLIDYFLLAHFILGLLLAFYYDTWLIAIGVGGLSLIAYYSAKIALPNSNLYQYVLGCVLGMFMAQYIYQMHGMFEMHFFAFIGSAIIITYQNWKLQIPLALFVIVHHASFAYLQFMGYEKIYFTQLDYMTLQTFTIHGILATVVFSLCGFWAYNFRKLSVNHLKQSFEIGKLHEKENHMGLLFSERKKSEEAILKSEKQYKQIVETAQEGIWMLDKKNRTVFANKKMGEILEYSPEEMLDKQSFDFMDEESKMIATLAIERRKKGAKENYELRFITKSGKNVWTHLSTNPILDEDGTYQGSLGMITDITEKKKAEEKVVLTEKLLSEAQQLAKVGNWNINIEKNEIFWSDGLRDIKGVGKDFVPSFEAFISMIHPEDKERVVSEIMKAQATGELLENWYRIIRLDDKETRIIHSVIRAIKNEKGKLQRVYGMSQDVTELKNTQSELEKTLEELENRIEERTRDLFISREFFSKTLQSIGDGVISTDPRGLIIFMNSAAEHLTGRTLKECEGKPIEFVCDMVDEQTRLPVQNPIKRALKENKITFLKQDVIMLKKDGTFHYIDDNAAPIYNDKGEIVGAVLIFKDITERIVSVKKLHTANKEIEEKNKSITDSIFYAKHIQEATLPEISVLTNVCPESFVIFKPKDIVSGDFYWFANIEGKFIVVVADCTGHGVPGAFMSMIGSGFLNEIVHRNKVTMPREILRKLNKRIRRLLKVNINQTQNGMDIAICSIDKVNNKLEFSGANRSLIHFKTGTLNITKGDKYGVGGIQLESTREYTSHEAQYEKGDTIYMFTDGYADQFGGEREKKLMSSNLIKLLTDNQDLNVLEQEKKFNDYFENWRGSLEQTDDVLLLGIKLNFKS